MSCGWLSTIKSESWKLLITRAFGDLSVSFIVLSRLRIDHELETNVSILHLRRLQRVPEFKYAIELRLMNE